MKNNLLGLVLSSCVIISLSGCGSNSDSSSNIASQKKGILIDDVISGVKYVNDNESGFTNEDGEFNYTEGVTQFYVGKIKIGEISSLQNDNKVFVQDLVGVSRTNIDDEEVLKIASFLQSLDGDKDTDTIEITDETFEKFNDEDKTISNIDVDALLEKKNIEKITKENAKRHLENILKIHGISNTQTTNENISISNLITTKGLSTSINVIFNEDIKKFKKENIFQLKDESSQQVPFTLEHNFNEVKLVLSKEVSSFDGYKLSIDVSKLKGYGVNGLENELLEITLGKNAENEYKTDIVPPVIEMGKNYQKNISTNKTLLDLIGKASDNTQMKEIILKINDTEKEVSNITDEFSIDTILQAGKNDYELIAVDTNENQTIITGSVYLGNTVAAGGSHTGAIYKNGLYTWGRNNYAQTGVGYVSKLSDETNGEHPISPIQITTPTKLVAISFNSNFSLGLDEFGDVYSWGSDKSEELGRGTELRESCSKGNDCRKSIEKVEGLSNIVAISAGSSHSLAIKNDGTVWGFGSNGDGQLGIGESSTSSSAVQVKFDDENIKIVQVKASGNFSLALDDKGQVWAWGKNNYGQMGQPEAFGKSDQLTPIKITIPQNEKITSIAAGKGHILVLSETGIVYGWGLNASSQLGYYGYQYKNTDEAWDRTIFGPKVILENNDTNQVTQVYAGGNSSYILREDKKIYPWGQYGETSDAGKQEYNNLDFPEDKLTAISSVKNIAAGSLHIAAVQEDETIFTWRWSYEGSLGGGEATANIWFYNYPIKPIFKVDSNSSNPDDTTDSEIDDSKWAPNGGNATVKYDKVEPFMKISEKISEGEISGVSQGRELFLAQWDVAGSSRPTLDGLGPLFNANACTSCHVSNGRVVPYFNDGTTDKSFLFRVGNEKGEQHPIFGGQLQTQATVGVAESNITWSKDANDNIQFISSADLHSDGFNMGGRISPHLLGMGLLDLVSEATILEYEDVYDSNKDGISGRAHWVIEEGETKIGRFGWKAINSSLRTQNAGALHQDMGLTSVVNMQENCTENQSICKEEQNGGSPEVSEASLQAIVDFMSALGVPERRIENVEKFEEGASLFETIGCNSCHRPTMITDTSSKFKSLSNQKIYPYTDLLLHDMGDDLSDGVKEKDASGNEWRTPPLWGIGIVEAKENAKFLHDGRASSIKEAIELHGGEAQKVKESFLKLDTDEQERLLEFLRAI